MRPSNPPRGCGSRRSRSGATAASRPRRTRPCRARAASTVAAGTRTPSALGTPSGCRSAACRRGGHRSTPFFSAVATYMAKITAAGELIVIEVVTSPRSTPAKRSSMSASVSTATPHLPTSPSLSGSSESRPISVGRSNAVDRPVLPAAQQIVEPLIGVFARSRSRRTSASSRASSGTSTRRARGCTGTARATHRRIGLVVRPVDGIERNSRHGLEVHVAGRRRARTRPAIPVGPWPVVSQGLGDRCRSSPERWWDSGRGRNVQAGDGGRDCGRGRGPPKVRWTCPSDSAHGCRHPWRCRRPCLWVSSAPGS